VNYLTEIMEKRIKISKPSILIYAKNSLESIMVIKNDFLK